MSSAAGVLLEWCCWRCCFRDRIRFLHRGVVRDDAAFVCRFGVRGSEDAQFEWPQDVCVDRNGDIVVVEESNHRVQVLRRDGTLLHKFGSHGAAPGQFKQPCGVCVDAAGHIVVADTGNNRVQIFGLSTHDAPFICFEFLREFGEGGNECGQFIRPMRVCVDGDDNIVVTDAGNARIQVFTSDGAFVRQFGCAAAPGFLPFGVAISARSGAIIVVDSENHGVKLFAAQDGALLFAFGSCGSGPAQLRYPHGVCVDGADNIFVADRNNNRIAQFRSDGTFVRAFGGEAGSSGPNSTQLYCPTGVCVGADGWLAVADFHNCRIMQYH